MYHSPKHPDYLFLRQRDCSIKLQNKLLCPDSLVLHLPTDPAQCNLRVYSGVSVQLWLFPATANHNTGMTLDQIVWCGVIVKQSKHLPFSTFGNIDVMKGYLLQLITVLIIAELWLESLIKQSLFFSLGRIILVAFLFCGLIKN